MGKLFSALKTKKIGDRGFTLVEIIVASTILGLLAAVTMGVINQQGQRDRAQDTVRRAALEDASQAIESFFASEGYYPAEVDGAPDMAGEPELSTFLVYWPSDLGVQYVVDDANADGLNDEFATYSEQSDGEFIKYSTTWDTIDTCTSEDVDLIAVCNHSSSNIAAASLVSITISPIAGTVDVHETLQFTATALFTDGTTQDYTNTANWNYGAAGVPVFSVTNGGLVEGLRGGSAPLQAHYNGVTATAQITVNAPPATITSLVITPASSTITAGALVQLTATAFYNDGSSTNVTSSANWQSDAPSVATVNNAGRVSGVAQGITTIRASFQGSSGTATVTVNASPTNTTAVEIRPSSLSMYRTFNYQFSAIALKSDGSEENVTDRATWSLAQSSQVLQLGPMGFVGAMNSGNSRVRATFDGRTDDAEVTVLSAAASQSTVVALNITPQNFSLRNGRTQRLTATARLANGTTQNVSGSTTWTILTANSRLLTLSAGGNITAHATNTGYETVMGSYTVGSTTYTGVTLVNIVPTEGSANQ